MRDPGNDALEKKIGYTYKDKLLLQTALTHTSYANEVRLKKTGSYERLEFLGDAVLEMISSEYFYKEYPDKPEGSLTRMRASAVCEQALAIAARDLELGRYIYFGKGEDLTGGRERDSILSDVVEALIGSIYLDGGLEEARGFISRFVLNDLEKKKLFYDAKSVLQERVQKLGLGELRYEPVSESGPEHEKEFEVRVTIDGRVIGSGKGHSKKLAQQQAAYEALSAMPEWEK